MIIPFWKINIVIMQKDGSHVFSHTRAVLIYIVEDS